MSLSLAILAAATLAGCQTASQHAADVRAAQGADGKLTVGTVQREIRVGMSSAEVMGVLGSPNIVTTDEERREVWVYDKISTEHAYSTSSGGVWALILGGTLVGSGLAGGAAGGGGSQQAGADSTSQRTLTVIIKFDENERVRDFAYHTSSF
ncbi:MAG: hypothetical protein ACE5H8_09495 [Alphaproteobacteria bacterium]